MTDRIPGVMADTCVRLFGRSEAFDSEGFATFFTDSPMYQFGNGEPCFSKAAIRDSVAGFFATVDALYHDVRNVWELGDVVFIEMDVIYWRKDGTSVVLPCSDILRFDGPKIQELRIFEDANPLFDSTLPVGPRASVFTLSEGRRAVAPGIMRRFFTDHAEGIHRAATGYPPKWALAGPRWPVVPKMDVLDALQGAIAAGDWAGVKSHLTERAVLRVGNRPEVTGPVAIQEALVSVFSKDLRPTNATYTGTWDPDNVLVVEMVVQAIRLSDGRAIEYPCVETYRFEGQKISEWRIYPVTATLLADERAPLTQWAQLERNGR